MAGDGEQAALDARGHRARVRERLLADSAGLLDHEVLEYLLTLATPRMDTKPLAKSLLREFGSIGAVLAADPVALRRVNGMGEVSASAIKIAHAAALHMIRGRAREAPVLANWQALTDYLHARLAYDTVESFRVIHLNTRNMVVNEDVSSRGTIDAAPVYVREVIKRALEVNAAAMILVHNHPSGDPTPSRADIQITRAIIDAGKPLEITVHDHVIVGVGGQVSLRAKGLI